MWSVDRRERASAREGVVVAWNVRDRAEGLRHLRPMEAGRACIQAAREVLANRVVSAALRRWVARRGSV